MILTKRLLDIIIPSYRRPEIIRNLLSDLEGIFLSKNFDDYRIIVVESETSEKDQYFNNIRIHRIEDRLSPGESRNVGMNLSNSIWVWFIDDDDSINSEYIDTLLSSIKEYKNEDIDIISHSLNNQYENSNSGKNKLLTNIALFKEKQEVFNHVFNSRLLSRVEKFSNKLHEDIKFVVECLSKSNGIVVLNQKIYTKNDSKGAITSFLNEERIEGYINAIIDIYKLKNEFIQKLETEILIQTVGTILYLIDGSPIDRKENLLILLKKYLPKYLFEKLPDNFNEKDTNFKYAISLYKNKKNTKNFLEDLAYCFSTELSCKDLRNSLFLGPGEIIGCCKRFFYDGKIKGDIVLFDDSSDVTLDTIQKKKKEIEKRINSETYEDCVGCPYISRFPKTNVRKIDYISLENFTYCNMRCTYCSSKYYGGKEAIYNTSQIIDDLTENDMLSEEVHVVWGGGEPTLKPKFKEMNEKLILNKKVNVIRILSNSLRYSDSLNELSKSEKIRLVTSIDAGTQETFQQIRGKGQIRKVLENLSIYKNNFSSPENLTIKYIFTEENYLDTEIDNFISLLEEYGFNDNFIQISCNFKVEKPCDEIIISFYTTASKLLHKGFKYVYFDDLIRDRLYLTESLGNEIIETLRSKNLLHKNIFSHKNKKNIVLWGNGYQSTWIQKSTNFGRTGNIIQTISEESELQTLKNLEYIICPAGIQSLPDIFKKIKKSLYFDKLVFGIFI